MFLVELVLQGVRGTRELARLRFHRGFNFVAAGNESGKTTAVDAVLRLLFPSAHPGLMDALVSRYKPDASRAALVMFSDDGAYYRVIQDFSKRAVNLSRYDTGTKAFTLMHKDWDIAAQFMAGHTLGISEGDFEKVFILRRDHYADRSAAAGTHASARHARPGISPQPAGKAAANQTRLAELRETLRKAEEAADAEYRAQSAKLALDEIGKKLATLEETGRKKAEIESTLAELKGCETLPENLTELIEAYEQRQGKKMADAEDLTREIEGLKTQLATIPSVNLFTDKLFLLGVALALLSIVAGLFILTAEQAQFFPIGVIVGCGLMSVAWYNGSRKGAQRKAVMREAEALENDIAELEKRFEEEGTSLQACMKAAGASFTGELREKADNYRHFVSLLDEIKEQRQRALGGFTPEVLQQEYNKRQMEAMELDNAARAVAQYNIDTYAIRQDIERIEAESAPQAAWDSGPEVREEQADFGAPATGGSPGGFQAELGIVSRIGEIGMETLVPAVEAAAQRNLAAVTGGRYVRIEVGQDNGLPIVHAEDESVVNYAELSHGTRGLVYFCLRAGLVEALAGKRRIPFILDDPLGGFDPVRQKAACQILRSLGAKTQVILFSSNPALRAEGDAVAELK